MLAKGWKKMVSCSLSREKGCRKGQCCLGAPLSEQMHTGRVRVCKVTGDRKVCARMASMGLYPGVEADVICPEKGSRCLLKINGGTISLDPEVSQNILVTSL